MPGVQIITKSLWWSITTLPSFWARAIPRVFLNSLWLGAALTGAHAINIYLVGPEYLFGAHAPPVANNLAMFALAGWLALLLCVIGSGLLRIARDLWENTPSDWLFFPDLAPALQFFFLGVLFGLPLAFFYFGLALRFLDGFFSPSGVDIILYTIGLVNQLLLATIYAIVLGRLALVPFLITSKKVGFIGSFSTSWHLTRKFSGWFFVLGIACAAGLIAFAHASAACMYQRMSPEEPFALTVPNPLTTQLIIYFLSTLILLILVPIIILAGTALCAQLAEGQPKTRA